MILALGGGVHLSLHTGHTAGPPVSLLITNWSSTRIAQAARTHAQDGYHGHLGSHTVVLQRHEAINALVKGTHVLGTR